VELDLSRFRGLTPVELFGRTSFPQIDEQPYRVSLGPHGFYWFCIGCRDHEQRGISPANLPRFQARDAWGDLLKARGRKALRDALEPYLRRHRWFASKARTLQSTEIVDLIDMDSSLEESPRLMLVSATYATGEPDAYVVPVMLVDEAWAADVFIDEPLAGILRIELPEQGRTLILCEATWNEHFWQQLLAALAGKRKMVSDQGMLSGTRTRAFGSLWEDSLLEQAPVVHGGEQSNTSATFDERFVLKVFRRVTPGVNPEFEIGRQLTEHEQLTNVPKVAGAVEYRDNENRHWTVAILHEFVGNVGDAWTFTLDELGRYFERVQSLEGSGFGDQGSGFGVQGSGSGAEAHSLSFEVPVSLTELMGLEAPPLAHDTIGAYLHWAELLGQRTAELHVALAKTDGGAAFTPEPFTRLYQRSLYQSMRSQARATLELLRSQQHALDEEGRVLAGQVLAQESSIFSRFAGLLHERVDARRARCHGDFHLGQVLFTGKDFVIIDFEGEPERPVSERRIKTSPLRDVAGMLRSLHYVSHAALRGQTTARFVEHAPVPIERWATFWSAWTSASFLQTYLEAAQPGGFLPADRTQARTLLAAYLLEKALYELRYELNNRPSWVKIPLEGILQLLQ
jgi:maltose alpha-D-glucosyltransferase/alpha-amylase